MATDYSRVDAALLDTIDKEGPVMFAGLFGNDSEVARECRALASEPSERAPGWRIADRRLIALRKAGRIRYQRKPEGWVRVEKEA